MTSAEIHAIGLAFYGTSRFLAQMSRDTGIPYRTLCRYAKSGIEKKPLAEKAIRALKVDNRKSPG